MISISIYNVCNLHERAKYNLKGTQKQEALGPHRSPEKEFQSINIITHLHKSMIIPLHWLREKKTLFSFRKLNVLICKPLSPFNPRMLCMKFSWNYPCGSGEEDLLVLSVYFAISLLFPLGKECGPSFELTWIPFNQFKDALCKFWLNLPCGSGEDFFNFVDWFSLFCYYLTLGIGRGPSFEQT